MFFLALDIIDDFLDIGLADRKPAIPALPIEITELYPLCLQPLGRALLEFFDDFGKRIVLGETAKDVDMIGGTVDLYRRTPSAPRRGRNRVRDE